LSLVLAEEARGYGPSVIIAVGRGGVYPALVVAGRLGVEKLFSVTLRKYSDEKPPSVLHENPRLVEDAVPELDGERVLVVDDVAHTGSTLEVARKLAASKGAVSVKTGVLVLRSRSPAFAPDYYSIYMDACPVFPWEAGGRIE